MHLVLDHVLEFLIVHRPRVDVSLERLPGDTRIKYVLPLIVESVAGQLFAHVPHFRAAERRPIMKLSCAENPTCIPYTRGRGAKRLTFHQSGFARQQLDEFADGHAGRKPVRVHDYVGADAVFVERHVYLFHYQA